MYRVMFYETPTSVHITPSMNLKTAYVAFNSLIAEYDKVVLFHTKTDKVVAFFEWS